MSTPILMYHRIESNRCPVEDPEERRYAVTLKRFVTQIQALGRLGVRTVGLGAFLDTRRSAREAAEREVVITFDDGNRSDFEHALPVLTEAGAVATFFISGERIGREDGLSEAMIREMAQRGMEIGSHGMTHRFLSLLDPVAQRAELAESRDRLSAITGGRVRFFAPPGGRYDRRTIEIARELGYDAVCTSRFGYNGDGTDPHGLKRIPVTIDLSEDVFAGLVMRSARTWWPAFLRSQTLALARRALGEGSYRRLRSMVFRG